MLQCAPETASLHVYVDLLRLAAFLLSASGLCVRCCDTRPMYSLGPFNGIDEMDTDHLKVLGCEAMLLRLQPIPHFL